MLTMSWYSTVSDLLHDACWKRDGKKSVHLGSKSNLSDWRRAALVRRHGTVFYVVRDKYCSIHGHIVNLGDHPSTLLTHMGNYQIREDTYQEHTGSQ